jgi:predicted kinase
VGAVDSPTDLDLRHAAATRDRADWRTAADGRNRTSATRLEQRLERLPAGHPSAPDYADRRDQADHARPFTDGEHAQHVADIKTRLEAARAAGLDTRSEHTIDQAHEFWSQDREAAHDVLLAELYVRASSVPCDHKAVVAGGLPGAGKTTVLREFAGMELSDYFMINPDAIKAAMARHGLVPDVAGLTPMEASELAHEESSHLARRLARIAQADGRNVVWDVTMSRADSAEQRIKELRADGYARVDGIFVDVPVEVAIERADARHREGHDAYRAGDGLGGRFSWREMIQAQADDKWGSVNRANFERVKDSFDAWARYDNSVDGAPLLVASSGQPRTPDSPREDL